MAFVSYVAYRSIIIIYLMVLMLDIRVTFKPGVYPLMTVVGHPGCFFKPGVYPVIIDARHPGCFFKPGVYPLMIYA